jgi:FhaA, N-terminal domain/FHA domain
MRPLSAVERFFERLFERPSARLFRARLHPVQVLRRVERAMERERRVEAGRTIVPDRFTVHLHPRDLAALAPADGLPTELASGALAFARRHGYALIARPRVAVIADPGGHPGEATVEARFSDPSTGPDLDQLAAATHQTRVFVPPAVRGPRATLVVHEPSRASRRIVADGGALSIGRAGVNSLVLADPRASRQHARLVAREGLLILTDLGSTNGTRVNGQAVQELAVGVGDEILIGDSVLVVEAVDDGRPGTAAAALAAPDPPPDRR